MDNFTYSDLHRLERKVPLEDESRREDGSVRSIEAGETRRPSFDEFAESPSPKKDGGKATASRGRFQSRHIEVSLEGCDLISERDKSAYDPLAPDGDYKLDLGDSLYDRVVAEMLVKLWQDLGSSGYVVLRDTFVDGLPVAIPTTNEWRLPETGVLTVTVRTGALPVSSLGFRKFGAQRQAGEQPKGGSKKKSARRGRTLGAPLLPDGVRYPSAGGLFDASVMEGNNAR